MDDYYTLECEDGSIVLTCRDCGTQVSYSSGTPLSTFLIMSDIHDELHLRQSLGFA